MNDLLLFIFLLLSRLIEGSNSDLAALDGFGNPVAWWSVLKLPMHVSHSDSHPFPTPCNCAPPVCDNVPTLNMDTSKRASGLCYLYADSNNPSFQYFRNLGYDCLGQGGNDPLSHTLRQTMSNETNELNKDIENENYWAIFNDQLNGIASSYRASYKRHNEWNGLCSGGDEFSAHAKGTVAFRSSTGGYYLQTSTPNYPDPSKTNTDDPFIRLGCQVDNNVYFAQHVMAVSLDMKNLNKLGKNLQVARLCSGNFHQRLKNELASHNFYVDGSDKYKNNNFSELYHALLDPDLPYNVNSVKFSLTLKNFPHSSNSVRKHSVVYNPQLSSFLQLPQNDEFDISVFVKSPNTTEPPWALLANALQSDTSVASWWDAEYGIPNICAGDSYRDVPGQFCLANGKEGVNLTVNGIAKYNVENLIQAKWIFPDKRMLNWKLTGGRGESGNHAKWGISTPRSSNMVEHNYVTFADLNMEGYPCSHHCNGSQAGRGGSFFTFDSKTLHHSLVENVVANACVCRPPASPSNSEDLLNIFRHYQHHKTTQDPKDFEELRMCFHGCWKKLNSRLPPLELPQMSSNATSYWMTHKKTKSRH